MIANSITISRIILSLIMLCFSPYRPTFIVFYLLCGVSDVLDGFIARKLHTAGKTGEKLDSIADLCFAVTYAVKILPVLNLAVWHYICIAVIFILKIFAILFTGKKEGEFTIKHSFFNKLTGVLVFMLPLTIRIIDVNYGFIAVSIIATLSIIDCITKYIYPMRVR